MRNVIGEPHGQPVAALDRAFDWCHSARGGRI